MEKGFLTALVLLSILFISIVMRSATAANQQRAAEEGRLDNALNLIEQVLMMSCGEPGGHLDEHPQGDIWVSGELAERLRPDTDLNEDDLDRLHNADNFFIPPLVVCLSSTTVEGEDVSCGEYTGNKIVGDGSSSAGVSVSVSPVKVTATAHLPSTGEELSTFSAIYDDCPTTINAPPLGDSHNATATFSDADIKEVRDAAVAEFLR